MILTTIGSYGAYPTANEATSSFLITHEGFNLLIDCGSGVLSKLQKILPLEKLDAVIVTHEHADHTADLICLQYAMMMLTKTGKKTMPLAIYAQKEMNVYQLLDQDPYTIMTPISEDSTLELGSMTITFARTIHPVPTLAVRVKTKDKTVVFTGDTEWCDALVSFAHRADILVAESSFDSNQQSGKGRGHLTAKEAGTLARLSHAKSLVLTHYPHDVDHERLRAQAEETYDHPVFLTYSGDQFM